MRYKILLVLGAAAALSACATGPDYDEFDSEMYKLYENDQKLASDVSALAQDVQQLVYELCVAQQKLDSIQVYDEGGAVTIAATPVPPSMQRRCR